MGKALNGKELGPNFLQRKDGLYQGTYKDKFGKRQSVYDRDEKKCRLKYAQAVADNWTGASVKETLTVEQWFKRWMEVYKKEKVRPNTLRAYTSCYQKSISPYLGYRPLKSLVLSDIQTVINEAYNEGYSYEIQNKIRILLVDMLDKALADDLVTKNVAKGAKTVDEKEINAVALTTQEQEAFFKACQGHFYENFFQVAVNTGLRPGELYALTEKDIDWKTNQISVTKTLVYQKYLDDSKKTFHLESPKTKSSIRMVPMNSICREYLKKQIELKRKISSLRPREQNDYLFVTKYNTPLNSVIIQGNIQSILKKAELCIEKISPHTFRHTFATRCLECGISPKVIQSYLGHATLKMTMDLYVHVTEEKAIGDIEMLVKNQDDVDDVDDVDEV